MTDRSDRPIVDGIGYPDMERRSMPHLAIITMKIDVRAMLPDERLDRYVMGDAALEKYGLAQKGQFTVRGYDEADCIKKVKYVLEEINGKTRE